MLFSVSYCSYVCRAAFFGFYDTAKALIYEDTRKANPAVTFGIGFSVETVAGTFPRLQYPVMMYFLWVIDFVGIIAYPFDTVRRRMMMQAGRKDILYKSSTDCWKKILVSF